MATSGSINVSTTRDELIKRALRLAGGLGIGETPETNQLAEAVIAFEHMIKLVVMMFH